MELAGSVRINRFLPADSVFLSALIVSNRHVLSQSRVSPFVDDRHQ